MTSFSVNREMQPVAVPSPCSSVTEVGKAILNHTSKFYAASHKKLSA